MEMEVSIQRRRCRPRSRQGGFSLIEVLIAAAILMFIALGVLPIYTSSMAQNLAGFDYTRVTNFAKERLEQYNAIDWGNAAMTIPAGSTQLVTQEYYSKQDQMWLPGTVTTAQNAGKTPLFTRVTTVEQFGINDATFSTPLDGSSPPGSVHLKEITVVVQALRAPGNPLGSAKQVTLRNFRSQ